MALNIKGNIISSTDITDVGVFKSVINREGLICYLDAGNLDSYPGSGTVWTDLSGNGNNLNLTNTTFSNGSIVFNGSSSYGKSASTLNLTIYDYVSVEIFVKAANTLDSIPYEHTANWNSNTGGFGLAINSNGSINVANSHHTNHNTESVLNYNFTIGTNWACHTNIFSKIAATGKFNYGNALYINNAASVAGSFANDYLYLGSRGGTSSWLNGSISTIKIYGRMLNPYEIAENFQATRGRFGI